MHSTSTGPSLSERCSGLPVRRYGADALMREFAGFELVDALRHAHVTPAGRVQWFQYVRLTRRRDAPVSSS
jgi:hypothetical protein